MKMKNLLFHSAAASRSSVPKCNNGDGYFRVFFSTEANKLNSIFPSSFQTGDALYHRLMAVDKHRASIVPAIDQWIKEGRPIMLENLRNIIKGLRKYGRSKHALQVFEWIDESKCAELLPGDIAIRLDLIGKTCGLEAAEKYFESIPANLRVEKVYGALLNCYAHSKSVEKAEGVLKKLREEFSYVHSLAFNGVMNLYYKLGKFKELHSLAQEMEEKGVIVDKFFYMIRLNAYAAACDVNGMEMFWKKMEANPLMVVNWNLYAIAANGYIRAGDLEKALTALKKVEHQTRHHRGEKAYDFLLTLYASIGRKADVYRIWNKYKGVRKLKNGGFLCMISALEKLGDLDAMEEVVEEWESCKTSFDIRIPNFLVNVYCKNGNFRKAEMVIERVMESGQKVSSGTWSRMAYGYCENNQMEKAVDALKKSIMATPPGGRIMMRLLTSCLIYLESTGNFQRAEDIMKLLERRGMVSKDFEPRLEEGIKLLKKQNVEMHHE